MVGADHKTIGADLGGEYSPPRKQKQDKEPVLHGEYSPPAIPPDDYDAVGKEQKRQQWEINIEPAGDC